MRAYSRKRVLRRIALLLAAFALLAVAAAVIAYFTGGPSLDAWAKARVRAELAKALGRPVWVGTLHVSPLSGVLEAHDLVVGEIPPSTGRVLEVPAVSATIDLKGLAGGRLELRSLRLEKPRVFISRKEDRWEGPFPAVQQTNVPAKKRDAQRSSSLVLRHLEVVDGVIAFEDRTLPLWCRADVVTVGWNGNQKGEGTGTLESQSFSAGSGSEIEMGRLRLRADVSGNEVSASLHARLGPNTLSVQGEAAFPDNTGLPEGRARVSVHWEEAKASRLAQAVLSLDPSLRGIFEADGLVQFARGEWTAEGRVKGTDLRYLDLSAPFLNGRLLAKPGLIEVRDLEARSFGGRIHGDARIEPRTGGELSATARAEGLSLHDVLVAIGLDSPLEGTGSLKGELKARIGEPGSLRVSATTTIVPSRSGARTGVSPPPGTLALGSGASGDALFAIGGTGALSIEGKRVTFASEEARIGSLVSTLKIEKALDHPDLRLDLTADMGSLNEGSTLLEAFLLRQTGTGLPWRSDRLSGQGSVSGRFTFSDHPVQGTLEFAFRKFAYEGIGAAVLNGTATADGSAFGFVIPRGEKAGGVLALRGSFPEGTDGLSRITGTLQGWPLDDVLARLGLPEGSKVRGSGPVEYRFGDGPASGEAHLELTDGILAGAELPRGSFRATLLGTRLEISSLTMEGPQASLTASGSYEMTDGRLSGLLNASRVDATLAKPWLRDLPIAGHAAVEIRLDARSRGLSWTAHLAPAEDLTFAGRPIDEITLAAEGDGTNASFEGTFGDLASFSGRMDLQAPHEGEGRIDLRNAPIAPLASLVKPDLPVQIAGELGGQISWSGPLDDTSRLVAHAVLGQLRLALGVESFETITPARITLEQGTVRFETLELRSGASHLEVKGAYPLLSSDPVDVGLEGEIDLSAISAFLPDLSASGAVRGGVHITGSRDEPSLTGSLEVRDGRLRIADFPLTADRIRLQARIDDDGLTADTISAMMGGGEFLGKGRVDLKGERLNGFSIAGRVTNVSLALPDGFRGQYSGSLEWSQTNGEDPSLTGDLDLIRGIWRKDFQLDKFTFGGRVREPVFQVFLPSEGLQRTTLNLRIRADDNVWCRNDLADVEGQLDLHLGGTIVRPELTGRFEAFEGGEMRFRRVRYQIEQGLVDFPPGPVFNPEYDISAETHVADYDVRIHLSGNLEHLDYELTSNPPLPQQQILSLLLTGTATGEESTVDRAALPGSAASVVGGEIGSLVGERLERWLGVEEIRIEPLLSQGSTTDPTTRVTLGKKLSPRIFVKTSVSLNSPEDPIYQVEYLLSRNLRFLIERGELGSLGGDIRYSTRFFSPFARRRASAPEASTPKKKRRVAEIHLLGDPDLGEDQLRRKTGLRVGSEFSRRAMVEGADRLKKFYVKESYLEASVRPSARDLGDGRVAIDYEIDRGPKLLIRLEGAGAYEGRIRKELENYWIESAFGGEILEDAEERIRRLLQAEGFYACLVSTRVEDKEGTKLVTFRIDPGEKVLVQDVQIEGATSIPENEVRGQVLTGTDTLFRRETLKPDTLSADIAAVENLYRSRGYLRAQARSKVSLSSDGRRAFVTIVVTEGPASRLRKVDIVGMSALPREKGVTLLESRPGGPFLPAKVVSDKEAIRRLYDEEGFPEVKVEEEIVSDGEDVDLTYRVAEGERKIVHEIRIEGNVLTKEFVIRREVQLAPEHPISIVKMRDTRQRLLRTGLFTDVQVFYEDEPDKSHGQVLKIRVREAENLVLGLGAGYDTENGPRGSILLANTNLLGRGLYAGVSALYGSKLERAQITVKESRLFQSLWGVTLSSFYEKRERESFSQRQVGNPILFERRTNSPLRHYLRLSSDISEVFDLRVPKSTFRQENYRVPLGRLRLVSAGYALVRDTRNDPLAATRGTYASVDMRLFGGRGSDFAGEKPVETKQRFSKTFLQGSYYRPLPLGFSWSSSARFGLAWRGTSEAIPLQERYFAGGDSTVRGFGQDRLGFVKTQRERLDVDGDGTLERPVLDTGTLEHETLRPLGGESLVILNNELRHRIVGSLSATAFLDAGNVYPRVTDITTGRLRKTAGLGLRLDTPVGPLRLEYGRKLDRERGESSGEYVLSLGQSF